MDHTKTPIGFETSNVKVKGKKITDIKVCINFQITINK